MCLPIMNKDKKQCFSAYLDVHYHNKENLSRVCSDIFEDLLRRTYDLDAILPDKRSVGFQTGSSGNEFKRKEINFEQLTE